MTNTLTLPSGGPSAAGATPETSTEVRSSSTVFGGTVRNQTAVDVSSAETTLGTLRNAAGQAVDPFNARPADRVSVNGMETTVANAVRMGLLVRNPNTGALMEGQARTTQPASSAPAQPSQPAPAVELPRNAREIQSALSATVDRTTLAAAMNGVLSNGAISDGTLNAMASQAKIEPSEMREHLAALGAAMDTQAQTTFEKMGLEGEDVAKLRAHLERTRPDILRRASLMHLQGNLQGYQEAAKVYFQELEKIDPERILSANLGRGISSRLVGKTIVLTLPNGSEVSYSAAVRQGIVRVG